MYLYIFIIFKMTDMQISKVSKDIVQTERDKMKEFTENIIESFLNIKFNLNK